MKTKNSIKNSITSVLANVINIIIGLIAQAIFIRILGAEYLGINGLFTNIISMLAIVELGLGNAIIYNLYKPIVNKDYKSINSLMKYYRKAYYIIAFIILVLGLSITPFLGLFVKKVTVDVNINMIYIMFIIDIFASYLLSYKRSMLYANQKNYVINIIHVIYYVILNIVQLLILYYTKNYYLYLLIKIIFRIIENIAISIYVNKKYDYLDVNNANKLDKNIKNDITKKIKALFFHKVGSFVVLGTDNLIISRYLGILTVGLYSNYYLIIDSVNKIFGQAITALTPSVGHLLVENNIDKNYKTFKRIRFLNFWIAAFCSVSILTIIGPFVVIWIGKKYLLSNTVLFVLIFNFYQKIMRNSYSVFKEAAGIYYEDRFVPIVESIVNIVVSIILVKEIGLPGVFIGTIISGLSLWCYSYPKFVYKKLFKREYLDYAKETIGYILLFLGISVISWYTSSVIKVDNAYLDVLKNIIISLIIPNLIIIALFFRNENFRYYIKVVKKYVLKFKKC